MKEMMSTRLHAIYQRVTTRHRANQALRILALLTIKLCFSACDRNDDAAPQTTAWDARLAQRIDSMWIASMQDGTVPGMSVVVIKGGKTFFQKGYGYADLQTKTPVTNDTRFAIGSTTKAMTAMAVLSLVDKGLVKLNDKVTTYIPDFTMKDGRYREITVSQLLSHSSGIKTFTTLNPPDNSAGALEGILPILANEDLAFTPGQGFFYSNYGSTLAGLLVQRVSGKPYETYMDEFLFGPIGMSNTTMEYWQPNALRGTKGYVVDEQNRLMESSAAFDRLYNPAGAGTITTSNDVARYLTTLVNGTRTPGGQQLLSDSLTTRLFTGSVNADNDDYVQYIGAKGTYGFGWYNMNRNGYVTIEHGGNILTFLSYFIIDPKTKSAVGILINREDFTKPAVAAEVARMVFTAQ